MSQYDVGDLVRLSATFTNSASALTNPTTVAVRVKDPSGTVTTPTAVNDSAGKYHVDVSITLGGAWEYSVAGTGAVQSAAFGNFTALDDPTT